MAFDATAMQRFIGGEATLYLYKTADTVATVIASGYFNNFADQLSVGDIILVSAGIGGTPDAALAIVATNNGTTVTTAANA